MAKADAAEAKKFPETLFVTREVNNQGDAIALQADYAVEDIDEREDGNLVGIYRLDRVERLTVTKALRGRGSDKR